MTDIDAVDYAVLKCMQQNGGCWKKRIHQWTIDHSDTLPMEETKSVQTIGRRIDTLHDQGLVESCILTSDAVNRDMIIGYTLTEDGEDALAERRDEFLRDMVVASTKELLTSDDYTGETAMTVDREPLIALMTDAFDIDETTREDILPQLSTAELLGMLATHFFLDNAEDTFDDDSEGIMTAFLQHTPEFCRPFKKQTVLSRVRERVLGDTGDTADAKREAVKAVIN